ncbi:maleylpyruvate isomerase family mycothiol-dependent enzyme [Nocardia crassostreae]|uniref:maleylpyruvate isomerase family mycothiol-dependent enzyme n=1 Tax=Nocardia crassostreae TaxID=53428 RepID=UPI00082C0E0A|nr:maleylpyruvate isomerase family mycothiol-dependent enzyme [Nocardia crassostreae]
MNVRQMLEDERGELVELLRSLSAEQWETPSLCAGWTVRDVVCHLQTDTVSLSSYGLLGLRSLFSVDRINNGLVERFRPMPADVLVERLATTSGWFSRLSPGLALSDTFVHQQDIRRPLGLERNVPAERLVHVLTNPDPFAAPGRYMKGLRWEATDIDWSKGSGPAVRGPGEALALAMVGRAVAVAELEGDGVALVRERCKR